MQTVTELLIQQKLPPEDTSGDADEATPSYTCNSLDLTLGTTGTVDNTYTLAAGAIDPLEPISVSLN